MDLLFVAVLLPAAWYFRAASLAFTTAHWFDEAKRERPFWDYYRRCFAVRGISDLAGRVLFFGLAATLYALAWFGYATEPVLVAGLLIFPEFFLGVLLGARTGDAVLSHAGLRLWFRSKGPNPGLATSPLYVVEAAVAPCVFPVSRAGFAVGFGAFAVFWSVSFLLKKR